MSADLSLVHPDLLAAVAKIIPAMLIFGYQVTPFEGVRTVERQQRLYAQGRNGVGRIVTNCDGVRNKSMHQVQVDGFGHAVDLVFLIDGKPSWADTLPWGLYGAMVQACGLRWGGAWRSMPDSPHMEIPLGR